MKAYTYQIGDGAVSSYSESIFADSLGEAIIKAKAITHHRLANSNETAVRIVEDGADEYSLWAASVAEIRKS